MNKIYILFIFFSFLSSCYHVPNQIEPKLNYSIEENRFINDLASAFPPLSPDEKLNDWGKEYYIARSFAHELDLYRAITSFKRAEILLMEDETYRRMEIQYDIILCYYLAKRYDDAIEAFEKSLLLNADKSFPTFHDLLVILYESYKEIKDSEKVQRIVELLEKSYPITANNINLSCSLVEGDIYQAKKFIKTSSHNNYISESINIYNQEKKSIRQAQIFNAILPGSGYLYIGQKKSALTSFLINSLFIASAYQFFRSGYIAAGVITTSFEMGWYFGGIYGAGEQAKYYNEKKYEQHVGNMMNRQGLFPVFMIQHTF